MSMRISGQVMGAPTIVATRRSVILSSEAIELRLTFWTAPSSSASPRMPMAEAPAAAAPADLKKVRRSSWRCTDGFMGSEGEKPRVLGFRSEPESSPRARGFLSHGQPE